MQAMTDLAELLVWDCFPESVPYTFWIQGGYNCEIGRSMWIQPSHDEGLSRKIGWWTDLVELSVLQVVHTALQVHCPTLALQSNVSLSHYQVPSIGLSKVPPTWTHCGGWMCLANRSLIRSKLSPAPRTSIPITIPFPLIIMVSLILWWNTDDTHCTNLSPCCDFNC